MIRFFLFLVMTSFLLSGCVALFDKLPHKKWGFINKSGKLVIAAKFDDVARDQYGGCSLRNKPFANFCEGLCAVRVGDKWGYIDKSGEFVIPLKFDNAGNFSEGLACVRSGTKYGYINRSGEIKIPMNFDFPGRVETSSNSNPDWDFTGVLIEPLEFCDGLAVAIKDGKYGFINENGSYVVEPSYLRADPFFEGRSSVSRLGDPISGRTFIDKSGKLVVEPDQHCFAYSENFYLASNGLYDAKRRLFYLTEDGKRAFPAEFEDARTFSEGLAAVAPHFNSKGLAPGMGNDYGYIDKTGELVIEPKFAVSGNNLAAQFHDGRAVVSIISENPLTVGIMHGVIDKRGAWIVEPKYEHISAYRDGLARAFKENRTVYLNEKGEEEISTGFGWGNSFSEGLAAVMVN